MKESIDLREMYEDLLRSKEIYGWKDELSALFLRHIDSIFEAGECPSSADIERLYRLYRDRGTKALEEALHTKKALKQKTIEWQIENKVNDIGKLLKDMIKCKRLSRYHRSLKQLLEEYETNECLREISLSHFFNALEEYTRPWWDRFGEWLSKRSDVFMYVVGTISLTIVLFLTFKLFIMIQSSGCVARISCGIFSSDYMITLTDKDDHWEGINNDGDKLYLPKSRCVVKWIKEKKNDDRDR